MTRHLHVASVADELAAIQAHPSTRAAVAALMAEGVDPEPEPQAPRIVWTEADVLNVGRFVDGTGRVQVALVRGCVVQHVRIRAGQHNPKAAAVEAANRLP